MQRSYQQGNFYPRPPRGGRHTGTIWRMATLNFYPRPPRGGRPFLRPAVEDHIKISIHALREEGDALVLHLFALKSISIHALREEGDAWASSSTARYCNFYPRPPRGGRPAASLPPTMAAGYFYPRPPRGGRPDRPACGKPRQDISIHALREEGDITFYGIRQDKIWISIHALREEGDYYTGLDGSGVNDFYPRPPRGGRPHIQLRTASCI